MTIDHIMSAISADRGAYVKAGLRIATSDLLIDEVDSFSANDCHAIARLCYISGMFGRRVVVSSATIPTSLISMFCDSYQKGYAQYSSAFGGELHLGAFSNITPSKAIKTNKTNESDFFQKYAQSCSEILVNRETRRKIVIIDVEHNLLHQQLVAQAVAMAQTNHSNIPHLFATGFVRFNFVKDAQKFFRYLLDNAEQIKEQTGWNIKTNLYHGQLDDTSRKTLESAIGALTNRKTSNWISTKEVSRTQENTLFLLVTTPVIEVGRDFDFDFAILEPSSYMSIIQSAGRVLRHRGDKYPDHPNVAIMSKSIRQLSNSNEHWYGKGPGFQQTLADGNLVISNEQLKELNASDLFGLSSFDKGIHSGYRLFDTRSSSIADGYEKQLIESFYNGFDFSIVRYLEASLSVIANNFDEIKFRDGNHAVVLELKDGKFINTYGDESQMIKIDNTMVTSEDSVFFQLKEPTLTKLSLTHKPKDGMIYNRYFGIISL